MKVLSFITGLSQEGGGPSRSVPTLVKGLAEVGEDVVLMTCYSKDMNTHALDGSPVKLKLLSSLTDTGEIEAFILSERVELIQLQSIWSWSYHQVVKIARRLKIPYVITPRGMLEPWSLQQKKFKKKLAMVLYQRHDIKKAACIYTTAEMEAEHIRDLGIEVPCSIIPNGIEMDGYPCRTSIDNVKKKVLFLSRIHEKKGIELLIDVWKNIYLDFPGWCVEIVGNGEIKYVDSLKARIHELGLDNYISILPPAFGEEKVPLYQESALFVLPSYSENFGMVIAEAMSCGVPVITTTNCPWKILNETHTGWCIDLSLQNLENALRNAMSMDAQALFEMGQRASKLIDANFNYRNVALKTKQLYQWIIEGGDKPDFVI